MPFPVKFNSGNVTGSIRKGNVALAVNNIAGPTSTTGWYNGPNFTQGTYQIIQVTSSLEDPEVFCPQDDNELIRFVKTKGATGGDTGSVAAALAWISTQNNLLVVNEVYPDIVTSNSNLILDAGFISSYPTTQSTVYSLTEDLIINTINSASLGANRYNNPGFAGSLVNTGQTYSGSIIWRTDFIPQNASFIPRLGSTEGFGFYHAMGTLIYTSSLYIASIYVSSSYPLQSSSTEGYSNTYSNMSGWGFNNTQTTRVNVGGGWTRLYTLWSPNVNGYAETYYSLNQNYTVNTTGSTTLIVSRSILQSEMTSPSTLWGVISNSPFIASNGGLTSLSILNHGLNTGSWTKASYPSNPILSGSGFPFTYYVQLSVPNTTGSNVSITVNYFGAGYYSGVSDNKFWKVTFNTSSLQVGQTASVYWAAPMIEPVYAFTPSPYVLQTGSIVSNGTLTNGTTWNQGGWFEFDGVDDYINIPNNTNLTNPLTVCALINTSVVTGSNQVFYGPNANEQDNWISVTNNSIQLYATELPNVNNFSIGGSTFISSSRWYHVTGIVNYRTASIWLNSNLERTSSVQSFTIAGWDSPTRIGQRATGQFPFNGKIAQVQTYNKALTQAEILQNYYQAPIVTNGLVFAVDASNLVSYESGSTTAYSLSLSGSLTSPVSCSLTNGLAFNNNNGGYFDFDGTDDQLLIENTTAQSTGIRLGSGTTPWMVNAWVRTSVTGTNAQNTNPVLSNRSGGPVYSNMGIGSGGVMKYAHYSGSWLVETGSIAVNDDRWHMLSWVNLNNNTLNMYVDGVFDKNVSSSIVGGGSINPVDIIGASWAGYLNGDIAFLSINISSSLYTIQDVSQNYNAQKGRFGL